MAMTPPRYPQYRVGQRVICRDPSLGITPGTLGTVVEIIGSVIIVRWDEGTTYGVYARSIEPAKEQG
jgi:hypothetical protein